MRPWSAFPYETTDYRHDPEALERLWSRLHGGDVEPWPEDPAVQRAWALFHAGEFEPAMRAGLAAGGAGVAAANKAQAVYASCLEQNEARKLALLLEVAERAAARQREDPQDANAWFWQAYALGRYAQGLGLARALGQGLGQKIRQALDRTLALSPRHADAHIALGVLHAELVHTAGERLARTQGADPAEARRLFEQALVLHPESVIARIEYGFALAVFDGEQGRFDAAQRCYEEAAACRPLDAMERLHVEMARALLTED
ncbi:tetratricopeptide repeat protein [Aquabacterium sp. A7-Y]|uniref:tetratricopeptide repeat protein n=1 Tax=Aquabacterium sp. A7-Y TaxID=1349605 RepID=UPI00223C9490|nr:tetratricopeptide repeat protein [Aquabacterium sp. A7-Y]MCW7537214.1 tetratricopeptide repeat protein [Aquabacterium sp. A7-Y]